MATATLERPAPEEIPPCNLHHVLTRFGLDKKLLESLNSDEGACIVTKEVIDLFKLMRQGGQLTGGKTFYTYPGQKVENSTFARNLTLAGASMEDVNLLIGENELASMVAQTLIELEATRARGHKAFHVPYRLY